MRLPVCCLSSATIAIALCPASLRSQESTEAKAAQLTDKIIKVHEAWRSKITSPGVTIRARESGRDGGMVQYRLYVTGLPDDRLYDLVSWPINQEQPGTVMEGVSLGKDGEASCTGQRPGECSDPSSGSDHGIDLSFGPAPGEPFRIALANGDLRAAIIIVPNPISAKDKNCTLTVGRLTPGFELANVIGSGYPPDADVTFESSSHGETRDGKTKANGDGVIHFAILPVVAGHAQGKTHLRVTAPACSASLKFDWGK